MTIRDMAEQISRLQSEISEMRFLQTSTEIAKKTSVSTKNKSFDNIDMQHKALRASNLLSLVDGSRKQPDVTSLNNSGYSAESIITVMTEVSP